MAEVVKKLGLAKLDGFLYFVESDGTVWKHQGGQKVIVSKSKIKRGVPHINSANVARRVSKC